MAARVFHFREILEAAAKPFPDLWDGDEKLNLAAVARYYKSKGHPISQATLHRLYHGKHKSLSKQTIDATHSVFRVPRAMLRGESMSAEMEKLLADYRLSTLLLAQKLESLPREDFDAIARQIDRALENRDALQRALQTSHNVTPIDKNRR